MADDANEGADLQRDQIVTQYGRRDSSSFRVRPRPGVEPSISLIAGRLSAEEAHRLVVRRGAYNPAVDVVRYGTVGDLPDPGFEVTRAPTVAIPDHVLVSHEAVQDDVVAEQFDACFGPTLEEEQ